MSQRLLVYPESIGVRLSVEDMKKLMLLCYGCQMSYSDMIRQLIRAAEAVDVPKVTFKHESEEALSGSGH